MKSLKISERSAWNVTLWKQTNLISYLNFHLRRRPLHQGILSSLFISPAKQFSPNTFYRNSWNKSFIPAIYFLLRLTAFRLIKPSDVCVHRRSLRHVLNNQQRLTERDHFHAWHKNLHSIWRAFISSLLYSFTYLLTYVLTYVFTYVRTYFIPLLTYLLITYLRTYLRIYLCTYLLYSFTYLLTDVITSFLYLLTYLLTPWCRVLLEKLTGLQLVKKFPAFHVTRRFITTLTSVRHLSLSWASPIHSIYPHPTSCRSIVILSTQLRLGLPSGLFLSGFPTKTIYTRLSSLIYILYIVNTIYYIHILLLTLYIYTLLTAIRLTPGDSSTVHIYTQTIHRTTQLNRIQHRQYIYIYI